jgi:hypothetical protein
LLCLCLLFGLSISSSSLPSIHLPISLLHCGTSLSTRFIIVIAYFRVTIATSWLALTRCYGHEQRNVRVCVSLCEDYSLTTDSILMCTCEVLYAIQGRRFTIDYLCVLFVAAVINTCLDVSFDNT